MLSPMARSTTFAMPKRWRPATKAPPLKMRLRSRHSLCEVVSNWTLRHEAAPRAVERQRRGLLLAMSAGGHRELFPNEISHASSK